MRNARIVGQFESVLWESPSRPVGRHRRRTASTWHAVNPLVEWTARPLGSLGRPLLEEIEDYLEFFAIAHADGGPSAKHS